MTADDDPDPASFRSFLSKIYFTAERPDMPFLSDLLSICAGCAGRAWGLEGYLAHPCTVEQMPSFS